MLKACASKVEGIENAYILVSPRVVEGSFGDERVAANMSFFFDNGNYGAEWEPEFGPIQIWQKADGPGDGIREHYFYDYVYSNPLNWSQLAVEREELPQAFKGRSWAYIFSVLEDWATR